MSMERSVTVNPPGFVPVFGQGLRARESQLGGVGTKEWLKSIKLHKYWPLISHFSYWQMMALTENNIEYNIKLVGGTEITRGAQGKLLRSVEELRERQSRLKKIIESLGSSVTMQEADLSYILKVVFTPFPTSEEDSLAVLVVHSVQKVKEHITLHEKYTREKKSTIDKIVKAVQRNPVLSRAEENLKSMPFLWDIQLTLTNYAVRSSRILPRILHERNRNISVDSGFEENSNALLSTEDFSTIDDFVDEMKLFTLELPTGNEWQKMSLPSPFYPEEEEKSNNKHVIS